jgi:hypothetical protein
MNCTICGKPTLPGAMLCAPCKAALKRARYVTVQEDMRRPSVIDVRRQPRRARTPAPTSTPVPAPIAKPVPTPAPAPAAAPPQPVPRQALRQAPPDPNAALGRRIFLGIFVVAAVLGGASYFGLRELGAHAGDGASLPAAEPRQDRSTSVAVPRSEEPAAPPAVPASAAAPSGSVAADPPAPKPPVKRAQVASRATFATTNGDPPEAVYVAPEPEKPAPAPPPPPPAPDRWQTMRDAQAQCDRQGVIDGLICGQRVKMQYCDGYWGKVPQCQGANVPYER